MEIIEVFKTNKIYKVYNEISLTTRFFIILYYINRFNQILIE